ncbi:CPBP family intramembrane glutamic endopeptidase [Bacillus sp. FJAT-22090]|uniref:CPBP family intramembrane glutamic endopeptidase n=1 Tax=Bacillus sp. FJAT-22090 TaxID=1581038 RepID=UPI0011AAF666|nr:CPBP family intramembrane glutamic endopeptidase [Bacillus sp. FJAT-22090]
MEKELSYAQKHPIKCILLIEACLFLLLFIAGAIATIKELSYNSPVVISFVPTAIVLIIYFTWKRKWVYFGFTRNLPLKNWLYYIPLVIILAVLCLQGFSPKPLEIVTSYIGFVILVGFVEESIYRGIMVKLLLPLGNFSAILISSALFSFSHILNLLSGQGIWQTGLQLIYALLIGIVLAQLFLKTGNIYPLIIFHSIHNLIQFLGDGGSNALIDCIVMGILCITAIYYSLSFQSKQSNNLKTLVNDH